jgi:TrpR-related protein YerC/YecD
MAKFANPSKLSKEEQERLILRLCQALCSVNNPLEAAQFLKDILSAQEAEMIAKRLKVAEFLIEGKTYSQICVALKVSSGTIAKIYEWLKLSGDGFKLITERLPKEKEADDKISEDEIDKRLNPYSWRNIKKRHPLFFWPQLLLEEVVKSAKEKDKKKIRAVLRTMDQKSDLYRQLNQILSSNYRRNQKIRR